LDREYFILEKDGIPVVGIMHVDDLEDYLETRNPDLRSHIAKSSAEHSAGKSREAVKFLAELKSTAAKSKKRPE